MDIAQQLSEFFKEPESATKNKTPEGICPVCWGYQEYDHKIRTLIEDKQIDVNNGRDRYMLVQQFVVEHLDGIKLKEGEISTCPTCGETEDSHRPE